MSQRYRYDCRCALMRNGEYLSPFKTFTFLWMSLVSVSQEFLLLFLVKQLSSSNIQSTFLHSDLQWVQQGPAWRQLLVGDSKFYPSPLVQTRVSYEIMSWLRLGWGMWLWPAMVDISDICHQAEELWHPAVNSLTSNKTLITQEKAVKLVNESSDHTQGQIST